MGWNDHLADPDEWEAHVEAQLDAADLARKQELENPVAPDEDAA